MRLLAEQQTARSPGPDGYVFANGAGRPLDADNFVSRVFKPAARAAGIPELTFDDLRHTSASPMVAAGCQVRALAEQMGHSDGGAPVLERYGHLSKGARRQAAAALEAHVFGRPGGSPVGRRWDGCQPGMNPDLGRATKRPASAGLFSYAPDRTRTCDLRFRRPTLYPPELLAPGAATVDRTSPPPAAGRAAPGGGWVGCRGAADDQAGGSRVSRAGRADRRARPGRGRREPGPRGADPVSARGGQIAFTTGERTLTGRNLRANAHAALCVDDERPPFSYVGVRGPVTLEDAAPDLLDWATRIS